MPSEPRAFFAVDRGAATTAAALIGRPAGRWRLLARAALPAGIPVEAVLGLLFGRVRSADRGLLEAIAGESDPDPARCVDEWARLTARTTPRARIAILAASVRQAVLLERAAGRAGWSTVSRSLDESDGLALTRTALDPGVTAILAGAGDPPGGDERSGLPELVALVAAVTERRPELQVVLAGGVAAYAARFQREAVSVPASIDEPVLLLGPDAGTGTPVGLPLRNLLESLRMDPQDARRAAARAMASLSRIVNRRIELVEIGIEGALRSLAWPTGEGAAEVESRWATVADAALVPPDVDDAVLDGVRSWSTVPLDRYRLADRLREIRLNPWGDVEGEGVLLRIAAARAALERLVDSTSDLFEGPAPDLIVAAGGAWLAAPPPVVGLALADIVRRPGTSQLALDHARLLGPLGTIQDDDERERLLDDLRDDLLVPLGSVLAPAGLRSGRSAGRLVVHAGAGSTELDLVPGGLELVDLPPGVTAVAELDFRDAVQFGARGRHFATQVSGGLGGLLVDLRDVPLRLPERAERRRELLDAWQGALWTDVER